MDAPLLELMQTVAGALGQFLERRRAEEMVREQAANAETLLRVSGLLAQELDVHKLVQTVTDESTRLCGAQFGAFFYNVIGAEGEAYTLYTLSGIHERPSRDTPCRGIRPCSGRRSEARASSGSTT
jgi:hypothetical protein